jgi:hypothetical protein
MKYAAEMGSGAMLNIQFHKDLFSHSRVDREGFTDTQTAW